MVYGGIKWVVALLFPFLLGMSMAFILNVPMRSIETAFSATIVGSSQSLSKIRRPVSFILTLIFILGIICIVILFIAPQLVTTFQTIINGVPAFLNRTQNNLNHLVNEYQWIADRIGDIEIDWTAISSHLTELLKTGAEGIFHPLSPSPHRSLTALSPFSSGFSLLYIFYFKRKN